MLTTLVFFGPRLAILVWWVLARAYVNNAFESGFLTVLAWLFIPWTVLMYLIVYPGGISAFEWVILVIGILADVASWGGGVWSNRRSVPGFAD